MPKFVEGETWAGRHYIRGDALPPALAATVHDEVSLYSTIGDMVTVSTSIGDINDARPLPCAYTAVFADHACALEVTGARRALHGVMQQLAGPPTESWSLLVEVTGAGCLGDGPHEIVEGTWGDLRLAPFTQGLNYSGGDGAHGDTVDADGHDLMAEIHRWAPAEQAAYLRGPGFSVLYTPQRDLYWYATSTLDGDWEYRLRDGTGAMLAEHESQPLPVLRSGAHVYLPSRRLR